MENWVLRDGKGKLVKPFENTLNDELRRQEVNKVLKIGGRYVEDDVLVLKSLSKR